MNIIATQYTLEYKSLDIYVAGCNASPKCTDCHNPESWSFDKGNPFSISTCVSILKKIEDFGNMIDRVTIYGGEPLDQPIKDLLKLMQLIKGGTDKELWLFTRYSIDSVPKEVKALCDYIKTGSYIPEATVDDNIQYGVKLATSNQNIWKKHLNY